VRSRLAVEDRDAGAEEALYTSYDTVASAGVFDALGIQLVRGRLFDDRDTSFTPPVAVVNQALASRFFPNEDPLGWRIRAGDDPSRAPWATIVGIVSDARNRGLEEPASPELWSSYRQQGQNNQMHLVLRTEGDPRAIVPSVRERLRALDPDLSAYAVQTLEERYDTLVFTRRFASFAMAGLASMSLLLAAMGLYGVIAFLVGERKRELGLRIALGADSRSLVGHVLGEAMKLVALGVALGLAGAFALTRFLSGMLFQVAPHDPATIAATVAVIVVVALAAALVPARRASRVDPVESLR
jgi:predicted permease